MNVVATFQVKSVFKMDTRKTNKQRELANDEFMLLSTETFLVHLFVLKLGNRGLAILKNTLT